ncbi:MAG TPA: SusC/RagA family TonB-linked outer membrane protein [Candidatus Limnocylindrales bacterium]|nr:SusC/RagA family TonB-linked outer membrane protein [Candidatus Limnocylindrales bacterium]
MRTSETTTDQQETIHITGVVTDAATGEPLPGVTVVIAGTTLGTATDANGLYNIDVASGSVVLQFSFVGYDPHETMVGVRRSINIALSPTLTWLDEVVVIGYGTQRRGEITGAVSNVDREDFQIGTIRDAAQLVQGRTAGLRVGIVSGDPTAGSQMSLRGISTIMASAAPLVIVDGVPGSLATVAPEDIESIDVLKDGAAAAIFGTRATNGVILITTRRPRGEALSVEYSASIATQTISNTLDFMDAADYRRRIAEGVPFIDHGYDTDWLAEISRDTPLQHVHNLLVQGSKGRSTFTASVNYRYFEGIFLKSDNEDLRLRLNTNHSFFDDRLQFNMSLISRNQNFWTGGDGFSFNTYVYRQALIRNPTDRIMDEEGNWQERPNYYYDNPVGFIEETHGGNRIRTNIFTGTILFTPVENLNLRLLASSTASNNTRGFYETKRHISTTRLGRNGFASRGAGSSETHLVDLTADYNLTLGNHRFTALAGYSFLHSVWEDYWMRNWDFPTDVFHYNHLAMGAALSRGEAPMSSSKSMSRLIGFFGRLNYNLLDRYLLMASLRYEGSSRFGVGNRWGAFPAVSVGWRLSQEPFIRDVIGGVVDNLMIRAGYGITGVEPGAPYLSLTTLAFGARFLHEGSWVRGLAPNRNPNPNLRWERKEETNIGLELSMFEHRVNASIDFYRRFTSDMLYNFTVPSPPHLFTTMLANVGQMENYGIEAFLEFVPVRRTIGRNNFEWRTNVSYSTNSNRLVRLTDDFFTLPRDYFWAGGTGEPIHKATHRIVIGGPIGDFFGFKSVGIDDQGRWLIEDPRDGSIVPYRDVPELKQVLGNGIPDHVLGWNHQIRYGGFDLNISMRGAFGHQILNFARLFYENPLNTHYNMLRSAFDYRFGQRRLNAPLAYVSYYIEDGDFWKIDNVALGYSFHTPVFPRARVYVAVQNLLTITGYRGLDPEVPFVGLSPGNDSRDWYPTTRTFTLGLVVNL